MVRLLQITKTESSEESAKLLESEITNSSFSWDLISSGQSLSHETVQSIVDNVTDPKTASGILNQYSRLLEETIPMPLISRLVLS